MQLYRVLVEGVVQSPPDDHRSFTINGYVCAENVLTAKKKGEKAYHDCTDILTQDLDFFQIEVEPKENKLICPERVLDV